MAESPTTVALMAGDVGRRGEVRRLARLVDRLARRHVAALVACAGGASGLTERGIPALEDPWLHRPRLRRIAVRRLPIDDADPPPSIVHALHDEVADAAAALAVRRGLPLIRTVEEDTPQVPSPRDLPPRLAALIVPDEGCAARLAGRSAALARLIRPIPPGIDPPRRSGPEAALAPAIGLPVIGAIGRFGPASGFETFLDAIHRVVEAGRDVEFLVAGHGPGEGRVRRRAAQLELAERLTFAPPAALEAAFWDVISIYCQPGASASGAVNLRPALVAGTPCIAADVPGPRELLAEGRGLLVRPQDPAALAAALLELLEQPLLARSLADRSRAWAVPRFDPESEADALAALYRSLAPVASRPP